MLHPSSFIKLIRTLISDCRGNIAMMFGLMLVPLTLAAGVGVDFAQAQHFKTLLQNAVDAAALAGASAYTTSTSSATAQSVANTYMTTAIAKLPTNRGVTFTATPGTTTASGATTSYTVAVSATARISTAFMSLVNITQTSLVTTAKAANPVTTVNISLNGFFSNACDGNTLYWFPIPAANDPNTYVPPANAMTQIWTNTTTSPPPSAFSLSSSSQKIGFALKNKTGQLCGYGTNGFGGAQGSTHTFYSNLYPPSKQAYPSVSNNHNLQVVPLPAGKTLAQVLPTLPDQAFNSNSTYAAPTCGDINGKTMVYAWNDMGGNSDDLDYNDAAYTFTCSGASGGVAGGATSVVLTQ